MCVLGYGASAQCGRELGYMHVAAPPRTARYVTLGSSVCVYYSRMNCRAMAVGRMSEVRAKVWRRLVECIKFVIVEEQKILRGSR